MAISLASLKRSGKVDPPIALVYSTHGLGKTSLGAGSPNCVFIQLENGLGMIEADTFGLLTSFEQVMESIMSLYSEEHAFKTVVIDSLDWLERYVWQETCLINKWKDIEEPGYGRGYVATLSVWRRFFDALTSLRDERGMAIIMLAHTEIKRLELPDVEAFDRYQPKLHRMASALVQEYADAVWFMNYRVSILRDDPKDKTSRARGVGGSSRVLYTTERPSHLAKNRFKMPDQIALPDNPEPEVIWAAVAQHVPYYNTPDWHAPVPATETATLATEAKE